MGGEDERCTVAQVLRYCDFQLLGKEQFGETNCVGISELKKEKGEGETVYGGRCKCVRL